MKYKVLVQHFGARQYWAGESREVANEQDAAVLINLGLIAPLDEGDNQPKPKGKATKTTIKDDVDE